MRRLIAILLCVFVIQGFAQDNYNGLNVGYSESASDLYDQCKDAQYVLNNYQTSAGQQNITSMMVERMNYCVGYINGIYDAMQLEECGIISNIAPTKICYALNTIQSRSMTPLVFINATINEMNNFSRNQLEKDSANIYVYTAIIKKVSGYKPVSS